MRLDPYRLAAPMLLTLALSVSATAAPQQPAAPQAASPDSAGITPAEVQRMFDAYALVQAQEALKLPDEQYARFVPRLKALQDARRRHFQARTRILGELRRGANGQRAADEAFFREQVKALRDEDDRTVTDVRQALDRVDEVLDVSQQARFRLFEDRMETRKLELLMRARQNARKGRAGS